MLEQIKKIRSALEKDLATVSALEQLQKIKNQYIGRKEGAITRLFEDFKKLDIEKKKEFGTVLNELKSFSEQQISQKELALFNDKKLEIDYTLPGTVFKTGHFHPVTLMQKELEDAFISLGFDVEIGPEIETDFYNFEALNIPEYHPARDMQDTFYLDMPFPKNERGKEMVLRTHVSNMQVRYMQKHKPPFAVILPGRVYRNEAVDASHEHTYQYMEGFVVGDNVSFSNMAWTLDYVIKQVFGQDIKSKFLPSYFPFVEPGAEMAISCLICKGSGCSVCKQTGWVEILGCGMIHQKVFEHAGYKKGGMQGFAFGGLSRLGLMRYQIPDIRLLAENDLRFLSQF